MALLLAALLAVGPAFAELPPPDYRAAVVDAAAAEVARLARDAGIDEAAAFAARWERQVGADAKVSYELGLAWRIAGDADRAKKALDRAVTLDPTLVEARYDRGELLLNEGDLDGAEADFREVVTRAPLAWPGHFRLADLAARRGDAATFEAELLTALRQGWSARTVVGDPRWRGYLLDERLGPVLRRLVTVYQDEATLRALEAP